MLNNRLMTHCTVILVVTFLLFFQPSQPQTFLLCLHLSTMLSVILYLLVILTTRPFRNKPLLVNTITYSFSTILFAVVVINYLLIQSFDSALNLRVIWIMLQPGILYTMNIGWPQVLFCCLAVILLYGSQVLAVYLAIKVRLFSFFTKYFNLATSLLILTVSWMLSVILLSAQAYTNLDYYRLVSESVPYEIDVNLDQFWHQLDLTQTKNTKRYQKNYANDASETFSYNQRQQSLPNLNELSATNEYNVVYVILESVRADLMTQDIMPNLYQLAQQSCSPRHHYSVGNSTAESLWGIFSGLSAFYWHYSKENDIYSFIYDIYQALDYKMRVFYASTLSYRGINNYVFDPTRQELHEFIEQKTNALSRREWKARPVEKDDIDMLNAYLDSMTESHNEKRVDILYFYSAHYNYYFPETAAKFHPHNNKDFLLHALEGDNVDVSELINRYKNSAYFVDQKIGEILRHLEQLNLRKKTILVIVGDHGEEFLEFGKIGHSTNLFKPQTQVPLVISSPDKKTCDFSISSHADITPTVLSKLGLNKPLDTFFSGKNLFDYDASKEQAILMNTFRSSIPIEFMLIKDDVKLRFINQAKEVIPRSISGLNDEPLQFEKNSSKTQSLIHTLLSEKKYFSELETEPKQ